MTGFSAVSLGILVAGIVPCLIGLVPLAALYKRHAIDRGTLLAVMYPVGATLVSLSILGLGLAELPLYRFPIVAVAAALSAMIALVVWWRVAPRPPEPGRADDSTFPLGGVVTTVAASLLIAKVLFVIFEIIRKPIQVWDAFAVWTLRAKVWAARESLVLDPADPFYLGGGARSDYPPHASLLHAWTAIGLGEWNDVVVNLPWAFYFFSAIAIVFVVVARVFSREWGVVCAAGLSGLPLLVMHATHAGYADMILAVHFLAACAMSFVADSERANGRGDGKGYSALSIAFLVSLPLIKLEGVSLVAAAVVGLVVQAPRSKRGTAVRRTAAFSVAVFAVGAILANKALRKYIASSTFHPEAIWPILGDLFTQGNWNLLWYAFWGLFALRYRSLRVRPSGRLALAVAVGFVPFLYVLLATDAWLFAMNQTADSRLFLSLAPAALLYVVIALAELCHESASPSR